VKVRGTSLYHRRLKPASLDCGAGIPSKFVTSDRAVTIQFRQKHDGGRRNAQRRHPRAYERVSYSRLTWCGCAPRSTTQPIADLLAVVTLVPLNEAPSRRGSRVSAFLPCEGSQLVRAAKRNSRGVRRDDPRGILDIADFVIDQGSVECLFWVKIGGAVND
jgi:hypothetical protein